MKEREVKAISLKKFFRIVLVLGIMLGQLAPFLAFNIQAKPLPAQSAPLTAINSLNSVSTNPVLLIYNDSFTSNKFGRFLGEIMKAEGFNLFDTQQLSGVTAALLADYDSVVLVQTSLSPAQATMFSQYVTGGGNLIAMRPDSQLNSVFGLGGAVGTLANGYMAIQTGNAYGQNFPPDSVQLHTPADQYSNVTAQVVATLYTNASSATSYPAVTVNSFGSGKAVAFTYDLVASVVYIRQGNPALANLDADGDGIKRVVDLYYNWIDLEKMPLPQADIQQRLFARLLGQLNSTQKPLPRMWYFPNAKNSVVVLTSDAHGNPDSYYTNLISSMTARNASTTFYLSQAGEPSPANVTTWENQGFGFSIHPYAINNTLSTGYDNIDSWFDFRFGTRTSRTARVHRLQWEGWVDGAKIGAAHGVALDYTPYRYGTWLQKVDNSWARGYMTGSGLPMKFIDENGQIVNNFAQYTEIADDQMLYAGPENLSDSVAYQFTKQAIDASEAGNNQAIAIQMHVDYYAGVQSWAESTLNYVQSLNLPSFNGDKWLEFTENRYNSTFSNLNWGGNQLTFTVSIPATQTGQTIMLPLNSSGNILSNLKVNGVTTSYTSRAVRGESFAFVTLPGGNSSLLATYSAPQIDHVSVNPSTVNLAPGQTRQFSAVGYDVNNNVLHGLSFNWSVVNGGGTIDATGMFTATAIGTFTNTVVATTNGISGTATVSVVNSGLTPTISGFSPATIINSSSSTLVITGTNFEGTPTVQLGTQSLSGVVLNGSPNLSAIVPAGFAAGVYDLKVTNPGGLSATVSNAITVRLPAPTLTSVSPNTGSNAVNLTINLVGTGFVAGASVKLGATSLATVNFVSSTSLNAVVPANFAPGTYSVTVTNPDGQNVTLTAAYTVISSSSPAITRLTPAVVSNTAIRTLSIFGNNFTGPVSVALSGTVLSNVSLVNPTTISFTLGAGYTPGTYDVKVTNGDGQNTTLIGGLVVLPQAIVQTAQAEFTGSTFNNTIVTARLDGEVKLKAGLEDYFEGTNLDNNYWISSPWDTGGTATVANGKLTVSAAYARSTALIPITRLEGRVKFVSGYSFQHFGFSEDLSTSWILFSVPGFDSSRIYARTNINGLFVQTPLDSVTFDAYHDFVILVGGGTVKYYVDGTLLQTDNVSVGGSTYVWLSSGNSAAGLATDRVVAGNYPTSGSYQSAALDAGTLVNWSGLHWLTNGTGTASIQARSSTDATNWSSWSSPTSITGNISLSLPPGRYLQYQLNLGTTDATQSPEVLSVAALYSTTGPGPVSRIVVTPANISLTTGLTQTFSAQGYDANNTLLTGLNFSWSVNGGGTIDSSGVYTAGNTAGAYPNSVIATISTITGSASVTLTLPSPTLTSVSPNSGSTSISTTISLTGTNFVAGASVKLGTNTLANVTFVASTKLTAVIGAGLPPGTYTLSLTNPDGQSVSLTNAYTVTAALPAPTLTQVTPTLVSNTVTSTIQLVGLNFSGAVSVMLSGTPIAGATLVNATTITFTLPVGFVNATYDVKVTNGDGQNTTLAAALTVLPQAIIQTSASQFSGGTFTNTVTTSRVDGEVKLKAGLEDYFEATSLDTTHWITTALISGGSITQSNGKVVVSGANIRSTTEQPVTQLKGRIKFVAGAPNQHFGFSPNLNDSWLIFSVPGGDTSRIYARTNTQGVYVDTPLNITIGEYHDFMIVATANSVQYYVDGNLLVTNNATMPAANYVWLSAATASPLEADNIVASNYPATGSYTSGALDAGQLANWSGLHWLTTSATGTSATIQARTSLDGVIWSGWSSATSATGIVNLTLPQGRYLQYKLDLSSSVATNSPEVLSVAPLYSSYIPGPVARIVVSPSVVTATVGTTQTFMAQAYDTNNYNLTGVTYTWSVNGGGTISSSGVYTAGNTAGAYPNSVIAASGSVTGSASVNVLANAPKVTSISPNKGSNTITNTIAINGSNFGTTPTVKLGPITLTNVVRTNPAKLSADVPISMPLGVYSLTVTNSDGQSSTLANAYTSVATLSPTITAVSPETSDNAITRTITISGTNFVATPTVQLNTSNLGSVKFISNTLLTAVVPANFATRVYTLTVKNPNPNGLTTTYSNAYTVTAAPTLVQNNQAAFNSGTLSDTAFILSGSTTEITLKPTFQDSFTSTTISNSAWVSGTWVTGGTMSIANGIISARGGYIKSTASYAQGVVEGRVRFSSTGGTFQNFGWGGVDLNSPTGPWAMFGVPNSDPGAVYARTNINGTNVEARITNIAFNTYYNLKIALGPSSVQYFVNNTLVATHNVVSSNPLQIYLSSISRTSALQADWIRLSTFAATGSFVSGALDLGNQTSAWGALRWNGSKPTGTNFSVQTQTSVDGVNWSAWSVPLGTSGGMITSPPGRYIRYQLLFTSSSDLALTPTFSSITLTYSFV